MKDRFTSSKMTQYVVAVVLVLVPFHAFLTVWGSSFLGHYTLLRLWDDFAVLILSTLACWWLAKNKELRSWFLGSLLIRLIFVYVGLTLLLGFISYTKGEVTLKALGYGLIVNLRFLTWFLAVLLAAQQEAWLKRSWSKLLLVPAAIVVAFAALQYIVLPHDFLSHFGYSTATNIAPIETINHNAHYIRVQSTLRGANPLGAYLVIILSALGALFLRGSRKVLSATFGLFALFALYASGSRSAWLATLASLLVVAWFWLPSRRARTRTGWVAAAVVVVFAGLFLLLRHNTAVQNTVLHTQSNSTVSVSSNDAHASALKSGLEDTLHQPFGDGPGTAGPASQYNTGHPVRIAEDYYVQIAQETGWLGLVLLLGIFYLVLVELYRKIKVSRLALILFGSFIGLAVVNLLSHAWTDDTLAFTWWGLAGIALAAPLPKPAKEKHEI